MIKINKKQIDIIIYFLIAVFFMINLISYDYQGSNVAVVSTFFIIGIFSFYRIITSKKNISLKRIFYIFIFIFMFFAPLQQYLAGTIFWKPTGLILVYSDKDYLKANLVLMIFIAMFEFAYKIRLRSKIKPIKQISQFSVKSNDAAIFLLDVISIACFLILLLTGNIGGRVGLDLENSNLGDQILKILRFFPVACFYISIIQRKPVSKKFPLNILLYVLEIAIIYFPFNGSISRFFLFGIYLSIISLFFSHSKMKSMYFLLFVVGFFIVFSSFNFFKTNTLEDLEDFSLEIVDFKTNDYDAYQMLMATMRYVAEVGVTYGKNFITALFCFIPRSIWTGKMTPSGEIVAEYYGTWFTNLSSPLMAECFFAFGWLGVVLGGAFIGWLLKWIDSFDYTMDYIKKGVFCAVSGLLIFILRGALLPTFAYTVAIIISLLLVVFINSLFSKEKIVLPEIMMNVKEGKM